MAEVSWIKIVTDIFDDEKILLVEAMPEHDAIIVIWFKLLCLAGKQNNSGVFLLNDRIPYTDEMFATIFRRPLNVVRMALKIFEELGMIEIINNTVTIPKWGKHQSLEQLEAKREYMRGYMQEYRRKQEQKMLESGDGSRKTNGKTNSKANVSEAEKSREKKTKGEKEDIPDLYADVVAYLNEKAGMNYRATTPKTRALIRAREKEGFALEDFKTVIDNQCAEWLKDAKMAKYLRPETLFGPKFEGYLNTKSRKGAAPQMNGGNMDDLDGLF